MAWRIEYTRAAIKALQAMDSQSARRIYTYLKERIAAAENPRLFGESLVANLAGYWKYRVGAYRVIADIQDEKLIVVVVKIGHRSKVYGGH